jgi:hypothetical protein
MQILKNFDAYCQNVPRRLVQIYALTSKILVAYFLAFVPTLGDYLFYFVILMKSRIHESKLPDLQDGHDNNGILMVESIMGLL